MLKTLVVMLCCTMATLAYAQSEERPIPEPCELLFSTQVDEKSFKSLEQEWTARCISDQPVTLTITSSGGDPDVGAAMHDWIIHKGWNTVAAGKVYSAAVPVFLAGQHRTAMKHSLILIHPGAVYIQEKMTDSEVAEMVTMDRHQDRIYNEIISEHSGLSIGTVDQMVESHTFLTATEAVEKGFAHAVK